MRMSCAMAKARALTMLTACAPEAITSAKIAAAVGCAQRKLTGDTAGVLFLLEAEGLVGRIGRTKGTRWFLDLGEEGV